MIFREPVRDFGGDDNACAAYGVSLFRKQKSRPATCKNPCFYKTRKRKERKTYARNLSTSLRRGKLGAHKVSDGFLVLINFIFPPGPNLTL